MRSSAIPTPATSSAPPRSRSARKVAFSVTKASAASGSRLRRHGRPPRGWVAFESLETCHRCAAAEHGRFNKCPAAVLVGMQRDGVFAESGICPPSWRTSERSRCGRSGPAGCGMHRARGVQLRWRSRSLACSRERTSGLRGRPIGLFAAMLARWPSGRERADRRAPALPARVRATLGGSVCDVEEFFAEPAGREADVLIEDLWRLSKHRSSIETRRPHGASPCSRAAERPSLRRVDPVITQTCDHRLARATRRAVGRILQPTGRAASAPRGRQRRRAGPRRPEERARGPCGARRQALQAVGAV